IVQRARQLLHLLVLISLLAGLPTPGLASVAPPLKDGATQSLPYRPDPAAVGSPVPTVASTVIPPTGTITATASVALPPTSTTSPSATWTPTQTASPSATTTETPLPTSTATMPATATASPSPTTTASSTVTPTPTSTASPTVTSSPTISTTLLIEPEKGGTLVSLDGQLSVSFPPGAVSEPTRLTYRQETARLERRAITLREFRLEAISQQTGQPITQFARPYVLKYTYGNAEGRALGLSQTRLAFLQLGATGQWSLLDGSLELKGRTVNATATSTGAFAVAADPTLAGYLDEADVEPALGGQLVSRDGRLRLDFVPGTVAGKLRITYRLIHSPQERARTDAEVVRFELLALDQTGDFVTRFQRPLTVTVSYTDGDISGLEPASLRLRYFDEVTSEWITTPSAQDLMRRQVIAQVDHFTTFDIDGKVIFVVSPLQDSSQVDLFTASATWELPLEVPPGPAGFAPKLTLSYSSATVNEMKSTDSQVSWVGTGFHLTPGYILRDFRDNTHDAFFLVMNGVSDRLVKTGTSDADGEIFRTEHESFLKIRYHSGNGPDGCAAPKACRQLTGWFEVWSKDGTRYRFGFTRDDWDHNIYGSRHFWTRWNEFGGSSWGYQDVDYRLDLDQVVDPNGNSITISYATESGLLDHTNRCTQYTYPNGPDDPQCVSTEQSVHLFTKAAYPSVILYSGNDSGGAKREVVFVTANLANTVLTMVHETKKLIDVLMKVDGTTIRQYSFSQNSMGDDARARVLEKVYLRGTQGQWLYSQGGNEGPLFSFGYESHGDQLWSPGAYVIRSSWHSYLNDIDSYSGGSVGYTYFNAMEPGWDQDKKGWSRYTVQSRSVNDGMGGAPAVQQYTYSGFAYHTRDGYDNPDDWEFRGFAIVQVSDGLGLQSTHRFYQGATWLGDATLVPQQVWPKYYDDGSTAQDAEGLQGKLYEVVQKDSDTQTLLARTRNFYSISISAGVSVVYLTQANQLENGRSKRTTYGYDSYGNLIALNEYDATDGEIFLRATVRNYITNTSSGHYIVDRVISESTYSDPSLNLSFRETSTEYFYDNESCDPNVVWCEPPTPTTGNLTMVRIWDGTNFYSTRYRYDSYGNRTQVIDALNRTTTTTYDSTYHTFPISVTYPPVTYSYLPNFSNSMTESRTYYTTPATDVAPFGKLKTVTGVDGQTTKYEYDYFGRPTKLWKSTELNGVDPSQKYEYGSFGSLPYRVTSKTRSDAGGTGAATSWYQEWQFYDGLGRLIQEQKEFTPGPAQVQSTQYNQRGLVSKVTIPYAWWNPGGYAGFDSAKPTTQTSYDPLGRVKEVKNPDGTYKTAFYPNNSGWTGVLDEKGQKTSSQRDALGRLITVDEYYDATNLWRTSYTYNVLDKLTSVTDEKLNTTTIGYDKLGRKLSMQDPDMGYWSYSYDRLGNLISTTDARGKTTTYDYDQLNRLRSTTYANGTMDWYHWDGCDGVGGQCNSTNNRLGRLWSTIAPDDYRWTGSFDARGRVTGETWSMPDLLEYGVEHVYNALDQETATLSSDGENREQTYQGSELTRSRSTQLPAGWQNLDVSYGYNAQGQPKSITSTSPSGLATNYGYYGYNWAGMGDSWDAPAGWGAGQFGKLWQTDSRVNGSATRNIQLGYDEVGNVTRQTLFEGGVQQDDLTYSYDFRNRLLSMGGTAVGTYAYDAIGNITSKSDGGTSYTAGDITSSPRHAPRSVQIGGNTSNLDYDANGNLTSITGGGMNRTLRYDDANRLIQYVKADQPGDVTTTTFGYDADGQRTRKTVETPGGITTTLYLGKDVEYVAEPPS
ncbi:MAG: hypothetical protein EPO21_08975, partial [Chloroflexota bacterium]